MVEKTFVMSMYANKEELYKAKAEYYMKRLGKVRKAFRKYARSVGCGCCRDFEEHAAASEKLGKLLNFNPYSDGSGYNFYTDKEEK